MTGEVRIMRAGAERVDDLEPLWGALHVHHGTVDPKIPGVPMRTVEDSWPRRRAEYLRWLGEPDAFALIAEAPGGSPVGYAVVHLLDADDGWATGERFAELESLCVLPEARGSGLGQRIMDRVYEELRLLGVRELKIGVLSTNEGAIRFYERQGFGSWVIHYLGAIPDER